METLIPFKVDVSKRLYQIIIVLILTLMKKIQ